MSNWLLGTTASKPLGRSSLHMSSFVTERISRPLDGEVSGCKVMVSAV